MKNQKFADSVFGCHKQHNDQPSEEIPVELSAEPQDYELTIESQKLYGEIEVSI